MKGLKELKVKNKPTKRLELNVVKTNIRAGAIKRARRQATF